MGLSPPSLGSLGALKEKRTIRSFQMVMMEVGMGPRGGEDIFATNSFFFVDRLRKLGTYAFAFC